MRLFRRLWQWLFPPPTPLDLPAPFEPEAPLPWYRPTRQWDNHWGRDLVTGIVERPRHGYPAFSLSGGPPVRQHTGFVQEWLPSPERLASLTYELQDLVRWGPARWSPLDYAELRGACFALRKNGVPSALVPAARELTFTGRSRYYFLYDLYPWSVAHDPRSVAAWQGPGH